MTDGSVYQRHRVSCPRAADGSYLPHKCRGRWAYTIDLGRQGDGKRRQLQKSGFPSRTAAKEAMAEALQLLRQGDIINVNLTVDAYLQEWLTNKRGLRHSTSVAYESHVRLYLKPRLGALRLRELRPHHLDRMYLEIANGARGRPLSAATLRRIHATLNSALQAAVKRRLIPYNPAAHVELPTPLRAGTTVWTPQQLNTFFISVQDHRLLPLYRLIAIAGLRRGEAMGLRWTDVDLDKALLIVRRQVTDVRGKLTIGPPKTKAGVRKLSR